MSARRNVLGLFIIAGIMGFIFEKFMAQLWQYPTLQYFAGVPILIVAFWTVLLPLGHCLFKKTFPNSNKCFLIKSFLFYLVGIIIIEYIGVVWLGIRINGGFPPLLWNIMHAPLWLYGLYYLMFIGYVKVVENAL